jgi:hypothetical protein
MAAPVLSSISPSYGPPGTAITCLGSGFDAAAQVGCPALVATTFVSAGELRAVIPADLAGPAGGSVVVSVFVQNVDAARSAILPFTVQFPYPISTLQGWTNIEAVAAEVPGFKRAGRIQDPTIEQWIRSVAQAIAGAMMRRGLSLSSGDWSQADSVLMPTAGGVLELINRLGAAARLAAAVASDFTAGEWGLAKALTRDYEREVKTLDGGGYDRLFNPAAATVETGTQVSVGDIETDDGEAERAFTKDQVF